MYESNLTRSSCCTSAQTIGLQVVAAVARTIVLIGHPRTSLLTASEENMSLGAAPIAIGIFTPGTNISPCLITIGNRRGIQMDTGDTVMTGRI